MQVKKQKGNCFRVRFIAVLMLLTILLVSVTGCGKNKDTSPRGDLPKQVTVGTIRIANDKTVAYQSGFFKEYFEDRGIEVKMVFFDSGTAANVAFASGDLDFAEMGYTNAIVALDKNIPVELIWIHEILGQNEALVAQKGRGINSIKDLKGKKVATPFSSTSHYALLQALKSEGLDAGDITLLDMNTEDILAAWRRGDIDAAYTWEPTLTQMKETGVVITDSEVLARSGITTADIELVSTDFSKRYPQLVSDYLRAQERAIKTYKETPDVAIESAAKHLQIDKEVAKTQMAGTLWLGAEEQLNSSYLGKEGSPGNFHKVFMDTAVFLYEAKKIGKVPTEEAIEKFINTTYIEKIISVE
ncbi:MAG: ABC transporter substrate-binding protein [Ruminococcaceae bacterium]|nr:ABC transporter substrate-binding protein [Oscillospiraceae bacterium]